ncbi:RNA polymerase sigma factor SigM [Actinomadura fulvescens]|uniref:RNA polymerase sigma factor SigM n=1 Tax=Actinomadura fulvescens TaxID=46160 RepID=A0ABN3QK44_9ACTN
MSGIASRHAGEVRDSELLARHVQGDRQAFAELIHRHRDRMWAVAMRTLGDPEEAADALQDACLSAFRAAERFRGDVAVTTWLHQIVVKACLDRLRRRSARPATPMGDATFDVVEPDPTDAHGVALDVLAALASLPFEERAALVLVDMMGYPVDDAARALEVPAGTVKSRCVRGRARLGPLLRHHGERPGSQAPPAPDVQRLLAALRRLHIDPEERRRVLSIAAAAVTDELPGPQSRPPRERG